jgi:hypothetical protein
VDANGLFNGIDRHEVDADPQAHVAMISVVPALTEDAARPTGRLRAPGPS